MVNVRNKLCRPKRKLMPDGELCKQLQRSKALALRLIVLYSALKFTPYPR